MPKRLLPDPLVLLLVGVVALATLLPARGTAADAMSWLSTALITLLFFFQGAKLPPDAVLSAAMHWRLHLVILSSTFVLFPLLALSASGIAGDIMPPNLWLGILYLAALPSTVQSSIAFTSVARGNVPAAITAASASQVLGVFITPPLTSLLAGAHGNGPPIGSTIQAILLQILLPFIVGQLARRWIGGWVQRHKRLVGISDRGAILAAVYAAFSAAVLEGIWIRVPPQTLFSLFWVCLFLLAAMLLCTWSAARLLGFNRPDRITILFCGTKKSLVQGIPMARILFGGPDGGLIILPLMLFHQMQLMFCAWISGHYAKVAEGDAVS